MGNIVGLGCSCGLEARIGWIGVLKAGEDEGTGLDSRGFWTVLNKGALRSLMMPFGRSIIGSKGVLLH
jgi:hypothetical protein